MTGKTYTLAEVNAAAHNAVQEAVTGLTLQNNSTLDSGIRQRMAAALSGGYDFADTLHNIYLDYGYPAQLSFFNFWNMYRRFGIATRAIELYPDQTWLDDPTVEGSEQFNADLEKLIKSQGLWRRLKGLDTRQRVGRYAGLFMRVKDNLSPDKPLATKLGGLAALVDIIPLYESQLEVLNTDDDPMSENFGQPSMYQFSGGTVGSRNERTASTFNIHPSRIVIAAEGADNGSIYGIPVLESIYNDLMDLRKTLGGGGEGFYKNAAQSIVFNLQDGASAKANSTLLNKFNEQYDDFSQNRSRRAMWTPGMDAKTLDSNLMSPRDFADVSLMSISAGTAIPASLLVGNQTGRLAGDQDTKGFLGQVQARRLDFGTDMVTDTVDWFIEHGILPSSGYTVDWPDAQAPSKGEKLDNANKMTEINKRQFESGGDVPFSGEEIRVEAGFEAEELEELPIPDETITDE